MMRLDIREETEVKSGKCAMPVLRMLLQDRSGLDKNVMVNALHYCVLWVIIQTFH